MTLGNVKKKREPLRTVEKMAPKSMDSTKYDRILSMNDTLREKQRPPIYNPEDYVIWLKKWGKKSANGSVSLYSSSSMSDLSECTRSQRNSFRDYRNPMLSSSGLEMTLRQFGTVSELLAKLKSDLRLAYPSFIQILLTIIMRVLKTHIESSLTIHVVEKANTSLQKKRYYQ
ncbi:hypothetical protein JTB14_023226 [Gonioctena quinquepunctata]|nr:hypothetical protein JTB14_023226 [Gonioctena quinquepunctata]